ncbi:MULTISPECIES: lytic transglycosylase domain-containing protein [unclassified Mycobacterium]|uniref:lytic transglycosylase domain-containing protein n=1 Tax=unclassified Mycobacterium TaxID=2642494 RepID=UPI0012E8850F|nr:MULTISPECIES: lytic murein transglycosylase [unclassified Mycobacterium]
MSPRRWLRAAAVIGATAMLLASSCTWQLSLFIPEGVPPPPGDAVPPVNTHASGRPADQLRAWAQQRSAALEIPVIALEAYAYAARVAEVENPKCHIAWTTLAGIGQVESHHGTYRGSRLAPNGDVSPPIRGVRLDGTGGNLRIVDSAEDVTDDDGVARAMGPMQFIPETWRLYGVDAHNDGRVSPDNIDDSALAAAGYLCWRGKDLATPRGWITALRAYNNSGVYARAVRDWATAYAAGHPL